MNVRLVAYRKDTTSSTSDSTYELDLLKEPNISLNFQFSDVNEPEKRKGSFSQTFKLPFTDNNNEFFQNWYNVNLSTLVFDSRLKFDAAIYVGTVTQFEGYIQLKSVYKKAQYYDVVMFSKTSDLFAVIGEQTLRDAYLNVDNSGYVTRLNHTYNAANLAASWDGSASTTFQNTSGQSLRDADSGVCKVMYNMGVTEPGFYFNASGSSSQANLYENQFLRKDQTQIDSEGEDVNNIVKIEQFRPAIQLKELLTTLLGKAGFSYTSSFLDGSYFGKLFMTTCNHLAGAGTPVSGSVEIEGGTCKVGFANNGSAATRWGEQTGPGTDTPCGNTTGLNTTQVPFDTVEQNDGDVYNATYDFFTRKFYTQTLYQFRHRTHTQAIGDMNLIDCETSQGTGIGPLEYITLQHDLLECDEFGVLTGNILATTYDTAITNASLAQEQYVNIDISGFPLGTHFKHQISMTNWQPYDTSEDWHFTYGYGCNSTGTCPGSGNSTLVSYATMTWSPYERPVYGSKIDIPSCIDPSIKQKDFIKELIERFNLIIVSDPNNPSNLLIETYETYLGSGSIQYWTDKLDMSKEVIVKDTGSLQKQSIKFTDKEDVDLYNKEFKENEPELNVYGHINITETNNNWAKGEMKNKPLFSPYINSQVYQQPEADYFNTQNGTLLKNVTVQYEYSYSVNEDDGSIENSLENTNPKLFYYCGAPVTIKNIYGTSKTIYLHESNVDNFAVVAHAFTTFPVCSPFDITPSSDSYTLTSANKSLYWNSAPPLVGHLDIFNWSPQTDVTWINNSLYNKYWKPYLESLYHPEARMMEAYLNLNEVDIFNFKFNDEIFIKDCYWRILKIQNYQVGQKSSTKVTLLKVIDSLVETNCGKTPVGMYLNAFLTWCDDTNPSCTPQVSSPYGGVFVNPTCCTALGYTPDTSYSNFAISIGYTNGELPCFAYQGSLTIPTQNILSNSSIFQEAQIKSAVYGKITGKRLSFTRGSNTGKSSLPIIGGIADSMVIKYKTKQLSAPKISGESHKIVLIGYTEGNTRSFAYPEGNSLNQKIVLPINSNTLISAKAIATVIGGTSSSYVVGVTEAVSYNTAFRNFNGVTTQIGTAGGVSEWSIKEVSSTCTLYIDVNKNELRIGLDDSQTDTKRVWTVTLDLSVQKIPNLIYPFNTNWALYQNGEQIKLQNGQLLIWN